MQNLRYVFRLHLMGEDTVRIFQTIVARILTHQKIRSLYEELRLKVFLSGGRAMAQVTLLLIVIALTAASTGVSDSAVTL